MTLKWVSGVALLVGLLSANSGYCATQLDVEGGWGGQYRLGRWSPIFITASDPTTRNVVLDLLWPQGQSFRMSVRQNLTIGPNARTFRLQAPVGGWSGEEPSARLTDANTGKLLAEYPNGAQTASLASFANRWGTGYIGISGRATQLSTLGIWASTNSMITIGTLLPQRLPDNPLGYDTLDLLVLDGPNLSPAPFGPAPLSNVQQQAIVDWLRSGGHLVLWPGDGGFPTGGPLVGVLPGTLGSRRNLKLTAADLAAIGLPPRFGSLGCHDLTPLQGAEQIPLLNRGQATALSWRVGMGRVTLLPIDAGALPIDTSEHCTAFWGPVLSELMPPPVKTGPAMADVEQAAEARVADYLGNIKGAGEFSFNYVLVSLLLLMIAVGPLDWFVLRKLRRQPWTWVTTSIWIALITVAATFAGYLFKSGKLELRTLRTIDQIDDATIGVTDLVSLYSPRTSRYDVGAGDAGWWRPAGLAWFCGRAGLATDVDYHQTSDANLPLPMVVNVWTLRFLRGDQLGSGPPVLAADLFQPIAGGVGGTVTNLTDRPLRAIKIMTLEGLFECSLTGPAATAPTTAPATGSGAGDSIAAHAQVTVASVAIASRTADLADADVSPRSGKAPSPTEMWQWAGELNGRRDAAIKQLVDSGQYACIYAQVVDPPPSVALRPAPEASEHLQFIRAIVKLRPANGESR